MTLLLKNVRPMGGPVTDILITEGRIADIGPAQAAAETVVDGGNALVIPGLVDAHVHLDKTLWGMTWRGHQAGPTLDDKISTERRLRTEWDLNPEHQAEQHIALSAAMGTTSLRSHVDIDTVHGLKGLEGLLAARARYADVMDIEIVAFPQSGLMIRPGTAELLDEALANGADLIGGLDPYGLDRDPKGHLDTIFALADKHTKPIDIHLHEGDELGAVTTEMIVERTLALGMEGKVAISHAFCLGMQDRRRVAGLTEKLARADIAIITSMPPSRPVPVADELRSAGVRVAGASDNVRDTWAPYGNADMLQRAMHIGQRYNWRMDADIEVALDICTYGGAAVLGLRDYGLSKGSMADLVLVEAETVAEAVVAAPVRKQVFKRGKLVAANGKALA
ncbi:amidohydrolase family protein [Paradevosia shaoguanensis]|uniref:amidohydrolase family protein n=1 Tax=Paradevosia shaoguanensis TaxID=1335043 RepID=UPI0015FD39B9|nr:amidohydrolase family protein [Paradevosia shaoguanensis]QMV03604.1 amidohydrolase family protein [Devosia sp. D6-9]